MTVMGNLERVGYLTHTMSSAFKRKVAAAQELIAKHPDYGVSVSWGKDSVVLLHLAASVLDDCPALNVRYLHWAERLADHDRVRDETLAMLPNVRYVEAHCPGMWEMYDKYGLGGEGAADSNKAVAEFNRGFLAAVEAGKGALGIRGHFVGMRADESSNRRRLLKMRGKEYTKKNGENICLPLAGWNGNDIWAYHVLHNLPFMRIYDYAVDNRDRQRSEIAFGSTKARVLAAHGEFAGWQKCYPREYQAWIDKFGSFDGV